MGDLLDVVLALAVLGFALSGYRQGLLVGALSFVGFIGGGALGAALAPRVVGSLGSATTQSLGAVAVVFVAATVGQVVATIVGSSLRDRLRWRPARQVDAVAGGVISAVAVLVVAWAVAVALARTTVLPGLSSQVRRSAVLSVVDGLMPEGARTSFAGFRRLLDRTGFPPVFNALGGQGAAPVPPPDPAVLSSAPLKAARSRVLKVVGDAACDRRLEGTGFVYAPHHLMTNAHVVAGVRSPVVLLENGTRLRASVVLFDPRRDVAVLDVPRLNAAPLSFTGPVAGGSSTVVAGYPGDGPFTAVAARVRGRLEARGTDIYQRTSVTRSIYAVRARVRPGNSGGPLLTPRGGVAGVVFAASVDQADTGYALTAAEVQSDARAAASATSPVGTGGCD